MLNKRTVADLYQERLNQWSDIQGHLEFIRQLVVDENAQTVIELGVRAGFSTAAFLSGLLETGGHLWSVDIGPPPFDPCDDCPWTFIQGDDISPVTLHQLPDRADIVFIDTTHWFHHTHMELTAYAPRGRIVLLHDTELEHPHAQPRGEPPFPVRAAIDVYISETGRKYEERAGSYGLGIIR